MSESDHMPITSPRSGIQLVSGTFPATSIDFGPVKVFPDGSIERTAKFTTTDEAAKTFWEAVERLAPSWRS